jgi:predicted small metal-binding protein
MEMKCPKGDFTATGDSEDEVKQKMEEHAKSAHNMDQGSINNMFNDMKTKITGMFRR